MLNLSDITTKIRNVAMFVIVDTQFVGLFMIYLHTKSHISISNGSLLIAVKIKAEEYFRTTAMLLFYLNKSQIFFNGSLSFIISGSYIKLYQYLSHFAHPHACHVVIIHCRK
jgi:hypothetical protein